MVRELPLVIKVQRFFHRITLCSGGQSSQARRAKRFRSAYCVLDDPKREVLAFIESMEWGQQHSSKESELFSTGRGGRWSNQGRGEEEHMSTGHQ